MRRSLNDRWLQLIGLGICGTVLVSSCIFLAHISLAVGSIRPNPDQLKVEKTIQGIIDLDAKKEKNKLSRGDKKDFIVTEKELNAYIDYKLKTEPQKTIKSMVVNLDDPNSVSITSLVDFSQVKVPADSMAALLMRFFNGDQTIKVNGKLTTSRGKGEFQLARAELGGASLPPPLINRLLKMFGEKQSPPFDPTKPFDLPHGVQEVEIHKGYVKIRV